MPKPREPSWIQRNWKWFVPLAVTASLVLSAGLILVMLSVLRGMEPFPQTLARVRADVRVQQALGQPIDEGLLFSGSIQTSGAQGTASLRMPLHGPRGDGTVYVQATRTAGRWEYSLLVVETAQGRINLLRE